MKKSILLATLSFCLLLTACNNNENIDNTKSSENNIFSSTVESSKDNSLLTTKNQNDNTINNTNNNNITTSKNQETTSNTTETNENNFDYETALLKVVGEDYLNGKASMRVDDEEIFGNVCAVFKVGMNSEEIFVTQDWIAISKNGDAYIYDVVSNEWSEYKSHGEIDTVEIDNCIYMLNEYLREEFAVKYYDTHENLKKAIMTDEGPTDGTPDKLIGIDEEIPQGYMSDPFEKTYYPVYNFSNRNELITYFENYFTQSYLEEVSVVLYSNFFDYDGTLYLKRGGMGYGAVSLDFNSIDYSNLQIHNTVFVDELLFGEKNATLEVTFDITQGDIKISNVECL